MMIASPLSLLHPVPKIPMLIKSRCRLRAKTCKIQKISCLMNENRKPVAHDLNHLLEQKKPVAKEATTTLGRHVARRLKEIGVTDVFTVPGDSNLVLLDHILDEPGMNLIGCCNELNAGYAADGYARQRGVGACVFTFTVGGLSAINAIAGAYSESVPIICIVGSPNTNYYGSKFDLHHAINGKLDFTEELSCFKIVTCHQAVVNRLEEAQEKIDQAIVAALEHRKPVYISISCNLPPVSLPMNHIPLFFSPKFSDPLSLETAVEEAAGLLNGAVKPVLVAGPAIRTANACDAFLDLAKASDYAIAFIPSSKGIVPENNPRLAGCYWGAISSPACMKMVEEADAILLVGPVFNDLVTCGYSMSFRKEAVIIVKETSVAFAKGMGKFGNVLMRDFLEALAEKVKMNNRSYEDYCWRNMTQVGNQLPSVAQTKSGFIKTWVLYEHIQKVLSSDNIVVSETGNSWFVCQNLQLPEDCGFQIQMHYASLGWSIGATLGLAQAAPDKRVIACIGDGAFQMTGQEISSMVRYGQRSIIFVINNGGYGIECQIHDGPYNIIKNWDYTGLVDALHNGEGRCWTAKVRCEDELMEAIDMAMGEKKNCLCFIEVMVDPSDLSNEALQLGAFLGASNALPPLQS